MYRGAKPTQPRGAGPTVVGFVPRFGIEILYVIFCCRYGEELPMKNGAAKLESRRNGKCHPRGHGRKNGLFSSFSGLQCSTNNADRQGEDCSKKCTFTSGSIKKRIRLFGLTLFDLRRLAYGPAERNGINHSFNKIKKIAGTDWLYGFLVRRSRNKA
ncbi:hypothetical protein J437_LFUL008855 [Ladona fulva]|uniref:Uncharacterized protein n=1 Tax=Ladona fulva TaxID=123851 RepID=A0A8K0P318_LADFU|nr:hypothetical protein J437_LFUL008855 [Ladona fulva]